MILYLDTSLLVCALTREDRTREVLGWLATRDQGQLASSLWVSTEFSSALSVKLRSGAVTADERAGALALFTRTVSDAFLNLPISDAQFRAAARFADHIDLGVRSGDALHLAIAAEHGATLCTLDRRLAAAGPPLGVRTELV